MPVIRGTVTTRSGRPAGRARVYFRSAPVPVPDIAVVTREDGTFEMTAPVPGTYAIGAMTDDAGGGEATIVTGPEGLSDVSIQLWADEQR